MCSTNPSPNDLTKSFMIWPLLFLSCLYWIIYQYMFFDSSLCSCVSLSWKTVFLFLFFFTFYLFKIFGNFESIYLNPRSPRHAGPSQTREWTHASCTGRWVLYHWATREAPWWCFLSSSEAASLWISPEVEKYIIYQIWQYEAGEEMLFFNLG